MPKKKVEEKKVDSVEAGHIKDDLMAYINSELDKRLEKVVTDRIRREVTNEIDKANKKIIGLKNRKLFFKNVLLIIFLAIIVLLTYLLYDDGYFDKYFNHNKSNDNNPVIVNNKDKEEVLPPSLDELKDEYSNYLDPFTISGESLYIDDFYNGKLTKELKNYFTLNAIDFSKLEVEDDYNIINSNIMKEACNKLMNEKCSNINFEYNGNKIRYFDKLDSYITNYLLERVDSNIQREIIDITVTNKVVKITTVEGIVIDNQLYSISPNYLIGDYYDDNLINHQDELNKVIYTFNNKKLVSIEKG